MSGIGTRWVYLTDMSNSARVVPLDADGAPPSLEALEASDWSISKYLYPAQIADQAPIGLRRYVLEQTGPNAWRETGEQLPLTDALYAIIAQTYNALNPWNYDYPHRKTERGVTDAALATLKDTLETMMAKQPFQFKIVGLQPRFLMYFTDGNYTSQQKFIDLVPEPTDGNPFTEKDELRKVYINNWSNIERDAGQPMPIHGGTPLLYRGPAAVVRFLVDGQNPAFGGCRVYVRPDGGFICSDWCQRHDFSSYGGGINLQEGLYTFDSWIAGPCLSRALSQGVFKPTSATVEVSQVRKLLKRAGGTISVPTFAEAMAAADKQIAQQKAEDLEAELRERVRAVYADEALAAAPSPETRVDAVVAKVQADVTLGDSAQVGGVPFRLTPHPLYCSSSTLVGFVQHKLATKLPDGSYRMAARPRTCGVDMWGQGKVCFKAGNSYQHVHIPLAALTLDVDALRERVAPMVAHEDAVRAPVVDAGPITADVLAEAKAIADAAFEERLIKERAALLEANIAKAASMAPNIDAGALAPVELTYDSNIGPIRMVPGDDDSLTLTMPKANSKWHGVYRYHPNAVDKIEGPNGPGDPVHNDSPIGKAVRWYFETFLPQQLQAKQAAQAAATPITVHPDSFRCYPVVGGTTLERVVDGAVIDAVTVRRKANGHIYRVSPTGATTLLKDATVKRAAKKYFHTREIHPAPSVQPALAMGSDPFVAAMAAPSFSTSY